jgi:hypothetical protein
MNIEGDFLIFRMSSEDYKKFSIGYEMGSDRARLQIRDKKIVDFKIGRWTFVPRIGNEDKVIRS